MQKSPLILRTPLKGKRMALGGGLIAIGLAILSVFSNNGTSWTWDVLLAISLPFCAGLGFAGLDYVIRIEPAEPAVYSGWQFCGLSIGLPRQCNLSELNRIIIGHRHLPVTGRQRTGPRFRPVYPVWLMSQVTFLDYLLGWSPEYLDRVSNSFLTISRAPNFAVFPAWARYVAGRSALCLNVPVVDEKTGIIYQPNEIPREWLERERISFDSHRQEV